MNNEKKLSGGVRFLALVLSVYISVYSFLSVKFILMAWSNDFSFLFPFIHNYKALSETQGINLVIYTILGSILGGAVLGITSLHKYSAITKTLDFDHIWGYILAPLLSIVIGILIFCFLQSGLLVLTGSVNSKANSISVMIGYTGFGAIASYNWDVFIIKLQKLSKSLSDNTSEDQNSNNS